MAKKGARYKCEEYGVVVVIDDLRECVERDLICCAVPMKEVKPKAKKVKCRIPNQTPHSHSYGQTGK